MMKSLNQNNMANWEKLSKEFDNALNSMTKEDWDNWYENVEQKRINQNKMTNRVEPFYPVHQTEGEHTEAIEEFNKFEGNFTTEEQYWACRAGFINGYEIAKKKHELKKSE